MAATEVTSVSEINVVGILAQMGSRVITEVSNIMFEKFSQEFPGAAAAVRGAARSRDAATADAQRRASSPGGRVDRGRSIAWQAFKRMFSGFLQEFKNLFSGRSA